MQLSVNHVRQLLNLKASHPLPNGLLLHLYDVPLSDYELQMIKQKFEHTPVEPAVIENYIKDCIRFAFQFTLNPDDHTVIIKLVRFTNQISVDKYVHQGFDENHAHISDTFISNNDERIRQIIEGIEQKSVHIEPVPYL